MPKFFNKDNGEEKNPQIPTELTDIYGIASPGQKSFKTKIYELERGPGGRGQPIKIFVDEVEQQIVDEVFLRDNYGPGAYECALLIEGRTATTKRFTIKANRYNPDPSIGGVYPPQGQGLHGEVVRMKELFEGIAAAAMPFLEMYERIKKGNQPTGSKRVDALLENYAEASIKRLQGFEKILEKTLVEKHTQAHKPAPTPRTPYEPGKEIVLSILNTLKPYLDKFLNAGPIEKQVIRAGMNNDPQMQDYINNPQILAGLYEAMTADPEVGEEKAQRIFANMGIHYEPPPEAAEPPGYEEEEEEETPDHQTTSNQTEA